MPKRTWERIIKRRSSRRTRSVRTTRRTRRKGLIPRGRGSKTTSRTFGGAGSIFSDKITTKLVYQDTQGLQTNGTGVPALYQYSGNSLYDPDQTGTGHQPYWYTQIRNVYDKYKVWGSKISVTTYPYLDNPGTQPLGGVHGNIVVTIIPSDQLTSFVPGEVLDSDLQSIPYSRYKVIGMFTGNSKANTITHYMSTSKIYGYTKKQLGADISLFESLFNASPTNEWYWHIYMNSLDGVSVVNALMKVRLTYYATFNNRVVVDRSS